MERVGGGRGDVCRQEEEKASRGGTVENTHTLNEPHGGGFMRGWGGEGGRSERSGRHILTRPLRLARSTALETASRGESHKAVCCGAWRIYTQRSIGTSCVLTYHGCDLRLKLTPEES